MYTKAEFVRADILDRVLHEGDQGLWETVWVLNSGEHETPVTDKVVLSRQVTFELLGQGRIELWEGSWPGGPTRRLTDSQIAGLEVDDAPWHDPESAKLLVWVVAPAVANRPEAPST